MTNTISSKALTDDLNGRTAEEELIDAILFKFQQCKSTDSMPEIKEDLLNLKKKIGESDFKIRYINAREKALQQFIDDFPSMLGYWNRDLKNVHSNRAYASYFGKEPNEIRGNSIHELLGERIYSLNLPYIKGVLNGVPQTFERDIPVPNGKIKSTLANYIPHVVDNGVVGFFVVVTDITEKKQLEEKAKALEASLYEQSRLSSLGQMASGIAHEINNPVTIIYSGACLLQKEFKKANPDKNYILERLSEIETTALRIEKIVDGLRSLQVGRSEPALASVNLCRVVEQVLAVCANRFTNAGIKIVWQPSKTETWARCNDTQISEILLNLLNNAFYEVTKVENGYVQIEILESKYKCEIRISNNGAEISPAIRESLFLPFFTTKGRDGTGLGLKISRDLARANGGELTLSQKPMTEFVLMLQLGTPPSF